MSPKAPVNVQMIVVSDSCHEDMATALQTYHKQYGYMTLELEIASRLLAAQITARNIDFMSESVKWSLGVARALIEEANKS